MKIKACALTSAALLAFTVQCAFSQDKPKPPPVTPFATGFMDPKDNSFWGRPAYLAQLKDGSLLVSDEQLGAIYRISYSAPAPAKKN